VWSQILLIVFAALSILFLIKRVPASGKEIGIFGVLICLLTVAHQLFDIFKVDQYEIINDYLSLSSYSFVLIILLYTIRSLKPEYARYPYLFVFLPLIIPAFYPFIQGTDALTSLILKLLQAGSLITFLLLIIGHYDTFKRGWMVILTLILFLTSYMIYWYMPEQVSVELWMWQPQLAIGILLTSISFPYILINNLYVE
jgi:hypothetical protein